MPPQGGEAAAGRPPVLRLAGISKRFGQLAANDGISFVLGRGEVVALLGENGAGKTTLMNILFGHYTADAGVVEVDGRPLPPGDPRAALKAGIGMVHQHFTLAENMTVLDNIVLGTESLWRPGFDRRQAIDRIARLGSDFGLKVDPAALVATLSVGERQRVEILKALYRNAAILILDEPTAVLTPAETQTLFVTLQKLVGEGLSVIFISHKLNEVMAVSRRVLVLRAGKLAGERATSETSREELAALMIGRDVVTEPTVTPKAPGPALLELSGVSTARAGGAAGLDGVSLVLRAGEITGLAGVSGNGQASLAGVIAGTETPAEGRLRIGGADIARWSPRQALRHGIGRIPEDRHAVGTIADMSISENVVAERYRSPPFSRSGWLNRAQARSLAETVIREYDVRCPSPDTPVRLLSGGNMQKLILGRVLHFGPRIILANQPVRGLDIGAVAYVHRKLIEARDAGAAILLISEDLDEIIALSDRIMVMFKGRLSAPAPRGARSVAALGALMAGHGFEQEAARAA
jgi:simple sugar transport system ATP-binding protein